MADQDRKYLNVFERIQYTLTKTTFPDFTFKPKQIQVFDKLLQQNDMIAVLPTGYGKSILFQMLPYLLPLKCKQNIVLVITPLNSIISDQMNILKKIGITAMFYPVLMSLNQHQTYIAIQLKILHLQKYQMTL